MTQKWCVVAQQVLRAFWKTLLSCSAEKPSSWQGSSLVRAFAHKDSQRLPPMKGRSLISLELPSATHTLFICLRFPREAQHASKDHHLSSQALFRRKMLGSLGCSFHILFLSSLSFSQTYLMDANTQRLKPQNTSDSQPNPQTTLWFWVFHGWLKLAWNIGCKFPLWLW